MDEAKKFVDLIGKAIEKGVLDSTKLEGAGIPMRARGEWQSGESYSRGDVVNVRGVGLFIAKQATTSNPTASGSDNWLTVSAYGSGGGATVAGVSNFLALLDTPSTYAGFAGFAVAVNPTSTGLEFVPMPAPSGVTVSAAPPALPYVGQLWHYTVMNLTFIWRGSAWIPV